MGGGAGVGAAWESGDQHGSVLLGIEGVFWLGVHTRCGVGDVIEAANGRAGRGLTLGFLSCKNLLARDMTLLLDGTMGPRGQLRLRS